MRYWSTAAALVALTFTGVAQTLGQDTSISGGIALKLSVVPRVWFGLDISKDMRSTDSLGAYVEAVTPGGPAYKAGVRSGAVITKLAGRSLTVRKEAARRPPPWDRLQAVVDRLRPNDTIAMEFVRDGLRRTVAVVPSEFSGFWTIVVNSDSGNLLLGTLADLQLAPLNRELGEYFGTTKGVLVIHVPKEGAGLGLKSGDVVQEVDDRDVGSPSDLMRILKSYKGGQKFKLDVIRHRKAITITARL